MRISRFHFLFGAAFVLVFAVVHWLLVFESSPIYSYLLQHVEPGNFWRRIHTGPYIVAMLMSGNVHQPGPGVFLGAAAAQWFTFGFLLSLAFTGLRLRRRDNPPAR